MKKTLVLVLAALMVLAIGIPSAAATLKVTGEYKFQATLWNGSWWATNPAYDTWGWEDWFFLHEPFEDDLMWTTDFLDFSTLKLTFDFAEGDLMKAHIPLTLTPQAWDWWWAVDGGWVTRTDWVTVFLNDDFYFHYAGSPFQLSLTGSTDAGEYPDYVFKSFGDPLGLVDKIGDCSLPDLTFKAWGSPLGINTTMYAMVKGYHIDEDPAGYGPGYYLHMGPEYWLGRATYKLPTGHTLGVLGGVKAERTDYSGPVWDDEWPFPTPEDPISGDWGWVFDYMTRNFEADVTGPLFSGGTFTGAFALSNDDDIDETTLDPHYAYELNIAGVKAGVLTLAADFRGVDPDFAAVAPDPDTDDGDGTSDVVSYANQRQYKGTATVVGNVAGKAVTFQFGDDYRSFWALSEPKRNDIFGNATWTISPGLDAKLEVARRDLMYDSLGTVTDEDYKYTFGGSLTYAQDSALKLNGSVKVVDFWDGVVDDFGLGTKVAGGVDWVPFPGVKFDADASYEFGTFNVSDDVEAAIPSFSTLKLSVYGEAKQSLTPSNFKSADLLIAGYVGLEDGTGGTDTDYVGYGEVNFALNDQFSNKVAVITGFDDDNVGHYNTAIYDKVTYAMSPDSTLSLAYSLKDTRSNVFLQFVQKIGTSTFTIGYGKNRLGDPCENDLDEGKPWAWLCTMAAVATQRAYYTLTLTIPF